MKRMFSTLSSLSAAALAATAALWGPPAAAQEEEKVLNVYNWSDYIAEDTIRNFEKETGIRVRYDNFDNNEILHAKLVAGKTGYDVVVPTGSFLQRQIQAGVFQNIAYGTAGTQACSAAASRPRCRAAFRKTSGSSCGAT